ncbi:MAG: indolepyruvate oxidoreductase subunit beta [Syntrophaceae bacterium PtaU1.Bin231]|nr:MAG: indolepyruvate oxidoreductase subunit beta [Syntrophaceae bacterium PtaU1.Bin231]
MALGNPILANIVMIGALCTIGELPVGRDAFRNVVARTLPAEKLDVNLQAYDEGGRILRRCS